MPPVTQTLLIANVSVFLLQSVSGGPLEGWFALWPPGFGVCVWQLVTYGFLHIGIGLMFFYMLRLYVCGFTGTATDVGHFAHLAGMPGGWLAIQYRRRGFPFTRRR